MADKNAMSGLLREGSKINGDILSFQGKMHIDGEVTGNIESEDKLIVGKKGKINANIKVKHIVVMGRVEGTITNCDLLEIQEGGHVLADIKVKTLDIKPGAIFDGHCAMTVEKK